MPKGQAQRRIQIDVAQSMYDELEVVADRKDLNLNGVVYEAMRGYLREELGSGVDFDNRGTGF